MAKRRPSGDGMVRKKEDGSWEGRVVIGYDEKNLPKTKNELPVRFGEGSAGGADPHEPRRRMQAAAQESTGDAGADP